MVECPILVCDLLCSLVAKLGPERQCIDREVLRWICGGKANDGISFEDVLLVRCHSQAAKTPFRMVRARHRHGIVRKEGPWKAALNL